MDSLYVGGKLELEIIELLWRHCCFGNFGLFLGHDFFDHINIRERLFESRYYNLRLIRVLFNSLEPVCGKLQGVFPVAACSRISPGFSAEICEHRLVRVLEYLHIIVGVLSDVFQRGFATRPAQHLAYVGESKNQRVEDIES